MLSDKDVSIQKPVLTSPSPTGAEGLVPGVLVGVVGPGFTTLGLHAETDNASAIVKIMIANFFIFFLLFL